MAPGSFAVKRSAVMKAGGFPKKIEDSQPDDEEESMMAMLRKAVPHHLLDREAIFDLKTESSILHFSNGGPIVGDKVVLNPYISMLLLNIIVETNATTTSGKYQLMTFLHCWRQQTVGNWKMFVIVPNPKEMQQAYLTNLNDNRIE